MDIIDISPEQLLFHKDCHDLQGKSHLSLENILIENYKDKGAAALGHLW